MNGSAAVKIPSIKVLGTRIDAVQIPQIIERMEGWIKDNQRHNYIVVANLNTIVTGKRNAFLQEAVNNSSLAIPDGFPLLVMGRLAGHALKKRAYGPDLMSSFLKIAEARQYSHFFYGSTEKTLTKLIRNLKIQFPKIKIAGSFAPPFRPLTQEEDKKIAELINNSSPAVLWVGVGCPKQEIWMYNHREKLNIPVMIGVGAAFDFLAGTKPQAPAWLGDNGWEWLFRLATEPTRLWRRYIIDGSLFIWYLGVESVGSLLKKIRNKSNQAK